MVLLDFNALTPEEKAEIRRRKGAITRRVKRQVLRKYALKELPKQGERRLVRGGQGTGKSRTTAEQIARLRGETAIWWLVPTLEKAKEQADEYAALTSADSMRARVVRGRSAPDPRVQNEAMCPRHEVVNRAARMGVNVQSEICNGGCMFRFTCGFQRQQTSMREDPLGLFLMAADYLWLPCPAPRPDFIIADESVIAKATETISFDPARILDDSKWACPKDLDRAMYLRGTASLVRAAVTEHPGRELAFLREHGVTDQHLKDCADHLRMKEEATPAVNGAMPDKVISDILDAVEAREIMNVFKLFRQLRRELGQPRRRLNSVWFDPNYMVKIDGELERVPRVVVSHVRRPYRLRQETPVLCLDGTGSLSLNRKIFGDHMTAERFAVPRDANVYQVSSKTFSRQSITGTNRDGTTRSNRNVTEAANLRAQVVEFLDMLPGNVLLVSYKAAIEALIDDLPPHVETAHFGALTWAQCLRALRDRRRHGPRAALGPSDRGAHPPFCRNRPRAVPARGRVRPADPRAPHARPARTQHRRGTGSLRSALPVHAGANPRGRDGPGNRPRTTNFQPPEGVRAEQPALGSDRRSDHDVAGASPRQIREGLCPTWYPATFTPRSNPLFSGPVEVRGRCKRSPEVVAKNRGRIPNRYIIWRNPPVFFGGAEGLLSAQRSARTASLRTGSLGSLPDPADRCSRAWSVSWSNSTWSAHRPLPLRPAHRRLSAPPLPPLPRLAAALSAEGQMLASLPPHERPPDMLGMGRVIKLMALAAGPERAAAA